MPKRYFLDAIFMEQTEFGLNTVDNCFVLPRIVGGSSKMWMFSVPLNGRVTYSQPNGMTLIDLRLKAGWRIPGGFPEGLPSVTETWFVNDL